MTLLDLYYPFSLPQLPYGYDALAPAISAKNLALHYDKHFGHAVDSLNALLFTLPAWQDWPLLRLIRDWAELPASQRTRVRQHAGSIFAHDLYFHSMAPASARSEPSPALLTAMDRTFHGAENFFKVFSSAAADVYGSGFLWLLAADDGRLQLIKTPGHEVPLGQRPLLCCDLWEHAYYPDRQNRREEYISHFPSLIDWRAASLRYEEALQNPSYLVP